MLSERCAEVSGEIAKGNLIIAAKDAQIEQLQLEMVEMAKGGAG